MIAVCVSIVGCTKPVQLKDAVPVFPVSGVLQYQGQPMSGAIITFYMIDEQLTAQGIADDDGAYSLTTYITNDGAPDGDYNVTIYWPSVPAQEPTESNPDPALAPDRLKAEFASVKTSRLTATVESESNTIDFDLPLADRK